MYRVIVGTPNQRFASEIVEPCSFGWIVKGMVGPARLQMNHSIYRQQLNIMRSNHTQTMITLYPFEDYLVRDVQLHHVLHITKHCVPTVQGFGLCHRAWEAVEAPIVVTNVQEIVFHNRFHNRVRHELST